MSAITPVAHHAVREDDTTTKREEVMLESVPKVTINPATKKEDAKLRLKLDLIILHSCHGLFLGQHGPQRFGNANVGRHASGSRVGQPLTSTTSPEPFHLPRDPQ